MKASLDLVMEMPPAAPRVSNLEPMSHPDIVVRFLQAAEEAGYKLPSENKLEFHISPNAKELCCIFPTGKQVGAVYEFWVGFRNSYSGRFRFGICTGVCAVVKGRRVKGLEAPIIIPEIAHAIRTTSLNTHNIDEILGRGFEKARDHSLIFANWLKQTLSQCALGDTDLRLLLFEALNRRALCARSIRTAYTKSLPAVRDAVRETFTTAPKPLWQPHNLLAAYHTIAATWTGESLFQALGRSKSAYRLIQEARVGVENELPLRWERTWGKGGRLPLQGRDKNDG